MVRGRPWGKSRDRRRLEERGHNGATVGAVVLESFRLDGRVAIVTGGGRGIGAGIARALSEAGADIALAARTESDLRAVAGDIEAHGSIALVVPGDLSTPGAMGDLVASTVERFGRLDIIVNNLGGTGPAALLEVSERSFERAFSLSLIHI